MTIEEPLYSDKQLSEMKNQEDPMTMYIIVRKDLKLTPQKLAIQCTHAAQMHIIKWHQLLEKDSNKLSLEEFQLVTGTSIWIKQSLRTILVGAKEKDWEKIKSSELRCFVVKDAGLTEIPEGTETLLALWPMKKSKVPKLIKRLQKYNHS